MLIHSLWDTHIHIYIYILKAYYDRHSEEGEYYSSKQAQCKDNVSLHPVVYSARYGHASYSYPGPQLRFVNFAADRCDGKILTLFVFSC